MKRQKREDGSGMFRRMPPWPEESPRNRPTEQTGASRFWSWWLGKHLTRRQKALLLILVLPPAVLMTALKLSWDAENRARAQREWIQRKKSEEKSMKELRRQEKEISGAQNSN